jgi:hypothetical protein
MHGGMGRRAAALAGTLALVACWAAPGGQPADRDLAGWVDRRVRDWEPAADERRFDEIGWARDIRDALRLAKAHGRPVFLFTYDGAGMATFRC